MGKVLWKLAGEFIYKPMSLVLESDQEYPLCANHCPGLGIQQ